MKILLASLLGVCLMFGGSNPLEAAEWKRLVIGREGKVVARYRVEHVHEVKERTQGLMFRESLPKDQGMWFEFDRTDKVSMWMKNTLIPLDMLFVDEKLVIRHLHAGAKPGDLTPLPSRYPVRYVLELNAGQIAAKKLKVGDSVLLMPDA